MYRTWKTYTYNVVIVDWVLIHVNLKFGSGGPPAFPNLEVVVPRLGEHASGPQPSANVVERHANQLVWDTLIVVGLRVAFLRLGLQTKDNIIHIISTHCKAALGLTYHWL
jgi:hypothetical protein